MTRLFWVESKPGRDQSGITQTFAGFLLNSLHCVVHQPQGCFHHLPWSICSLDLCLSSRALDRVLDPQSPKLSPTQNLAHNRMTQKERNLVKTHLLSSHRLLTSLCELGNSPVVSPQIDLASNKDDR
jgi:hypothetical protein